MSTWLKFNLMILVWALFLTACSGDYRPGDINVAGVADATATSAVQPAPATAADAESPPSPSANSPALSFTLTGGIIGFCDELSLTSTGDFTLRTCTQPEPITGKLIRADLDSLNAWLPGLAGFTLNAEDNAGQADSLKSTLVFNGQGSAAADENQQRVIVQWANSLLIRIRPQLAAPPTPEPLVVGPEGLCPTVARPAVVVVDFSRPAGLLLVDPVTQQSCPVQLNKTPYGRLVARAGSLFYAIFDETAKTIAVWELNPQGEQKALAFTEVKMEEPGPYEFVISADGSKIAWSQGRPDLSADPPKLLNNLWIANRDGSNQVTVLTEAEQAGHFIEPIRFSADSNSLYYAWQPSGLGGAWSSFSGRYDSVYRVAAAGGESQQLFTCPQNEVMLCIGDVSPQGVLAYIQPDKTVVVQGSEGQTLATITPPGSDYIGAPVFGPTGNLALISATLSQDNTESWPQPNPGIISLLSPPYTGELKTLVSDKNVINAWDWLDENRLVFGVLDESGNTGTDLVTLEGQRVKLSPNFALAILP